MKSRSEIWLKALEELGGQCSVDTVRDAQTFVDRVKREGESFITLTLPSYGKAFERCLAGEEIPKDAFPGWSRARGQVSYLLDNSDTVRVGVPGLPKFMGGFMGLVFSDVISLHTVNLDVTSSQMTSLPMFKVNHLDVDKLGRMADAIAAVRQLCLMFSKEKELCSEPLQKKAIEQYVETDQMLADPLIDRRHETLFEGKRLHDTKRVIRLLFGDALSYVDGEIYHQRLVPGHGPGSTQDNLFGNQKWTFPTWHDRLEHLFPYGRYALNDFRHAWKYDEVEHLAHAAEPPVKVSLVAKTQRAPRLIAIEPTCMQYIQQGISRCLVDRLEDKRELASLFVGFSDQKPNNLMAKIGSEDGSLATLDLSEASDRVANWLVEDLFADFPYFSEGIDACRSTHAKLPNGDVIRLQKFASMGSAMTFPIEAMVFSAIAIERVLSHNGTAISRRAIQALRGTVRVYGDDIIVPNDAAVTVIAGLEVFGFKVNRDKSFWTGKFRESCGKEYWNGLDVSIVKVRKRFPVSQHDAPEIVSTVSTRNQFYMAGMWKTAALLDSFLGPLLKGFYPIVGESSQVLGRLDRTIPYEIHGFDPATQAPFVRGYVVKSPLPYNGIDGLNALMKCLVESIGNANTDDEHLKRSGRPRAVSIKLGKASPF